MALDPAKKKEMDALFKTKTGETPVSAMNADRKPIKERISELKTRPAEDISSIYARKGENIQQMIAGEGEYAERNALERGVGATAEAFSTISSVIYNSLPDKARKTLDDIGGGIGKGFDVVVNKISDNPKLQEAVASGETGKLESALKIVADLGLISGEVAGADIGAGGVSGALRKTVRGSEAVMSGASKVAEGVSTAGKYTGRVVSDVVPSPSRVVNYQVTRALDLTQGDIKNISRSTGNEVGEWLAEKNLIGETKDAVVESVKKFGDDAYKTVRENISKVDKVYKKQDVPRYEQALQEILKQTDNTAGLENVSSEVRQLLTKEDITLNDVQRVKELMDDQFSLYKVTGDVKESVQKEGLANIRREVKEFVEKEVKDNTGVDIAPINNDVATARSIENAVIDRSTRGLTRSNIKLGDLAVFGTVSAFASPFAGAAAVAAKKIIESPTVRLRIAKWLDSVSDSKRARIQKAMEEGNMPVEIEKMIDEKTTIKDPLLEVKLPDDGLLVKTGRKYEGKPVYSITTDSLVGEDIVGYSGLDTKQVQKVRQMIQNREKIEPIRVQISDGNLLVEDGKHRLAALRAEGVEFADIINVTKYTKK